MFKQLTFRGIISLLITFLISLTVVLFLSKSILAISTPSAEIRGVWITNIDSNVLFSSSGITQALKRLKRLNFNTIYPTVWQGGYTLYPSSVAQRVLGTAIDPKPELQNRDILQELVKQGHRRKLTVIPWFEFGFMMPADSEIVELHPDWITRRSDGTTVRIEGNDARVWLNPFHPEVQQFILDLITEIVTNYEIDGIQFDDHFGLPSEFGYDPFTVELYQSEHQGQSPSPDFYETYWVRWRSDKINQFMERVFYAVKAIKSDCIISLSPNPFHFALPAYLQDWFTWERRGFIEEIILQVYRPDLERFITELERTEVELAKNHIPVAIGILSGLKNRSMPMKTIKQQVQVTRDRNFAGVSFFFYESLWNWAEETERERKNSLKTLFFTSVSRPSVYQNFSN